MTVFHTTVHHSIKQVAKMNRFRILEVGRREENCPGDSSAHSATEPVYPTKSRRHGLQLYVVVTTLCHRQHQSSPTLRDAADREDTADDRRRKMAGTESAQQASLADECDTGHTGIHSLQQLAPSAYD